jgi:hypothetical protein
MIEEQRGQCYKYERLILEFLPMVTLKAVWEELARAADLEPNQMAPYIRALRDVGLIPRGRSGRQGCPEATPRAAAWLIVALLCGSDAKRAVDRAKEVAQFRNRSPSVLSFSTPDGQSDHRQSFLAADPNLTFINVRESSEPHPGSGIRRISA